MNKKAFIQELSKHLSYSIEECTIIDDILESNFFISKKNKDKIIEEFISRLNIQEEEASKVYDVSTNIIKSEIKNAMKHPFRDRD